MRKLLLVLLLPILAFADDPARRRAIEANLGTPVAIEGVQGKPLAERMKELGVPAISFAVVENGEIVLAAAYGEADVASHRKATPSTLFQAASISKPVTALAVLDLVERGKLSLDTPVNSILRTWKLPENELTAATPITLRLLLSHSAGTTVHGFPGYAMNEERPKVVQILEGKAPANTAPIVVDLAPNTKFRYSGGGTTVTQLALIDHTSLPFPDFMRRTVLTPLDMTRSTYQQPLPAPRRTEAATAYNLGMREVGGKFHVYPEMAAAGLWTTPTDLAKVIIELQNAMAGRATKLLSIDAARHMLTPRFPIAPTVGMGIGMAVQEQGGARYFTHTGSNEGFRAVLIGSMDGSRGAVVMGNSDSSGALTQELVNTIAREYGWPGYGNTPLKVGTLANIDQWPGRYQLESEEVIAIRRAGESLEVLDATTGWQKLYPMTDGALARADRKLRYELDAEGLVLIGNRRNATKRLAADAPLTGDELLSAGRIEEALAAYRAEFAKDPKSLPEQGLNAAGYTFLSTGRMEQALALLRLNTELYPDSANTYDSYAEALIAAGRTAEAIAVTEEMLRRIEANKKPEDDGLRRLGKKRLEKLK